MVRWVMMSDQLSQKACYVAHRMAVLYHCDQTTQATPE